MGDMGADEGIRLNLRLGFRLSGSATGRVVLPGDGFPIGVGHDEVTGGVVESDVKGASPRSLAGPRDDKVKSLGMTG